MAPNGSLGPQILGGCFFVLYAIFGLWHTVFALLHHRSVVEVLFLRSNFQECIQRNKIKGETRLNAVTAATAPLGLIKRTSYEPTQLGKQSFALSTPPHLAMSCAPY
jgi:hypothetical protein